eukprot:TRINITY_DN2896_c0_g1_i16.p1 TRINITY_DN2896_c0_g1~~TRINITY_DN2896_c0_g1_i16.p1  ORF type:complete len:342 (+),score=54.14 TRINITY_DN2896_c0_g1_i16:73-1098(+)
MCIRDRYEGVWRKSIYCDIRRWLIIAIMNKAEWQRMLPLQAIVQPRMITIKASALTKSSQSPGILSKIGSFLSSLWHAADAGVSTPKVAARSKTSATQVFASPLEEHASVVLPALDPSRFQEEFSRKLARSGVVGQPLEVEVSENEEYFEDEGFYYSEDPPCTPTAKKLSYGEDKMKVNTAVSEDKASWADTYGGESDTGASSSKEPTFPANPPLFISPAAPEPLAQSPPACELPVPAVERSLDMVDDDKLQRPIMVLPFTTQAAELGKSLAADFPVPVTMETGAAEKGAANCLGGNSVSWSQVVRFPDCCRTSLERYQRKTQEKVKIQICLVRERSLDVT